MKYQRKILASVEGYVPGEQPRMPNIIKLNTNENPYPPSPKVLEALQNLTPDMLRKYPDPLGLAFRQECAKRYGYPDEKWVMMGNGMDELLAMVIRTFMDPGDTLLTTYPTYTLYETLVQLHGATCTMVDLDDAFQLTEAFYTTPARVCIVPRPNAPSGICPSRADMERLCKTFDGVVMIDEAYVDFADDSCMDFPQRFDNVIVTRTFSKSFSLAGMRIGVAVANPALIAEFIKTKDSYNMNVASQAAALAAMQDYDWMVRHAEKVRATRASVIPALESLGFVVPPSQSNFVLAQWNGTPSAAEIFVQLRERAIIVRYFDIRRLQNALRISIGTEEEMVQLMTALREIIGSAA